MPPGKQSSQVYATSDPSADSAGRPASVTMQSPCVCPLTGFYSTLLAAHTVLQGRLEVENILKGDDDRLLVVVGYASAK